MQAALIGVQQAAERHETGLPPGMCRVGSGGMTHPPGLRLFHHWWLFRLRADIAFQPEKRAFTQLCQCRYTEASLKSHHKGRLQFMNRSYKTNQ